MRKHISTIVLVIILIIGICVLLYTSVSNYVNQIHATQLISDYETVVNGLSSEQKTELIEEASAYNAQLASETQVFQNGDPQDSNYASLLNVSDDGVIGYVTIRKLGVRLPILHGTSETVLTAATGHLEGSSLPVGGANTHAVITGHRGLPSAKLFTDLDQLEAGDTFTITVLDRKMTYEVDKISIVDPGDTSGLEIIPSGDYATLLTCTPYGINTQRLLVRGVRVADDPLDNVTADAVQVDPMIVAGILGVLFLAVLLIVLTIRSSRRKRRRNGLTSGVTERGDRT